ncbi:MAG: Flp pilus assembly protein TadD [Yoonia sp.]|jgi:Flp pilus assembly protein TadD
MGNVLGKFSHISNMFRVPQPSRILTVIAAIGLAGCDLSGTQPVGFQARVDVAERMLLSGQYDNAYRLLDEVSADNNGRAEAQLSIGNAYLRNRALFKARNAFNQAIQKGSPVDGQLGLGRVALAQNDSRLAFEKFDLVLVKHPTNKVALNGRGVAFDLQGEHQRAIAEYKKLLAIDPTNLDALNNLALSHAIGGLGHEAVGILQDLTESQLTDVNLRHNLAIAYAVVGRNDAAYKLTASELPKAEAQRIFTSVRRYRDSR